VLTPLQQRLLDIVSRLPEADGFALAGGAALILRGTVARDTNVGETAAAIDQAVATALTPS
jgi:hypothetical protein